MNERLSKLERMGLDTFQRFEGEDYQILKYVFLLQSYLKYYYLFDELIQTQLGCRETSVRVPFADEAFMDLKKRGYTDDESLHYFAMYYQLRRAFYFIEDGLIGDSLSMKKLRLSLWNNVFTQDIRTYNQHLYTRMEDFSTLLLGETGTGKGAAAAAIGRSGYIPFDRKKGQFAESFTKTFVAINLTQFSESLIESELFGHQRGAFTGAVENHEGVFERCNKYGSLFLDEIGDASISVQIKLLKVLQERSFTPVGSHEEKYFPGRVIGATQHPIEILRGKGNFRADFFYRLSSDIITVPPLRKRVQEMPSELGKLVNLLISRLTGHKNQELANMILQTLKRDLSPEYPWPGNVRELEQAVRRILLTRHYGGDLTVTRPDPDKEFLQKLQEGSLEARELLSSYCNFLYQRFGNYEEVARRTKLDRRTVKKYIDHKRKSLSI
jgi:transcriptional regulator with PAS, ATPase and Fis domain